MPTYFLDTQAYLNPFQAPPLENIILSLQNTIPNSESMIVQTMWGNLQGVYKVIIDNNALHGSLIPVNFPGKGEVALPLEGDQNPIPLEGVNGTSPSGRSSHSFFVNKFGSAGQKTGKLITFVNCTSGVLKAIKNSSFDDSIQKHGALQKMTELQKLKGTTCFNGNRYCVIEPKGDIPSSIQVPDEYGNFHTISIRFKGQSYYCGVCNVTHVGPCPAKQAFYAEKAIRAKLQIDMQIISDSTLRQVDQLGLSANVMCMSGGRAGNVANILHDDPSIKTKTSVIVVAGFNDVTNNKESLKDFELKTDCAISKFVHSTSDTQKLTLISPLLAPNFANDLQRSKLSSYNNLLQQTSEQHKNVFVFSPDPTYVEFLGIHPTANGTANLIHQINEGIGGTLLRNADFIVAKSIYQGCQSVLTYGCIMCNETFNIIGGMCPPCRAAHNKPAADGESPPNAPPPTEPIDGVHSQPDPPKPVTPSASEVIKMSGNILDVIASNIASDFANSSEKDIDMERPANKRGISQIPQTATTPRKIHRSTSATSSTRKSKKTDKHS